MLNPIKRKKNSILSEYVLDNKFDAMSVEFEVDAPRRIRGFIEAEQHGHKTFIVDFQLSKGMYYGWSLWDMSNDVNGVSTLQWILEKDFPIEIQECIIQHFNDRGYSQYADTSMLVKKTSNEAGIIELLSDESIKYWSR